MTLCKLLEEDYRKFPILRYFSVQLASLPVEMTSRDSYECFYNQLQLVHSLYSPSTLII